jgi:hypothetical protein
MVQKKFTHGWLWFAQDNIWFTHGLHILKNHVPDAMNLSAHRLGLILLVISDALKYSMPQNFWGSTTDIIPGLHKVWPIFTPLKKKIHKVFSTSVFPVNT